MPPSDSSEKAQIRYFLRILAALTQQVGGELHIPLKDIRGVADENSPQLLTEDTDIEKDELVLRFGSKHSAVYPIAPEICDSPKPLSTNQPLPSAPNGRKENNPTSRLPLSVEELQKLERKVSSLKAQAILRSEQRQRDSLNPLEQSFRDLER